MESRDAVNALSALAQEARLAVFRLLVQAGPAGLPVGDIGRTLDIPPATLSFHLSQLKQSGLVACRRDGRTLYHSADFRQMDALIAYLGENCCAKAAAACGPNVQSCQPKSPKRRSS